MKRWLWIAAAAALLIWYGVEKRLACCRNHGCWAQPDPPCLQSHTELRQQESCVDTVETWPGFDEALESHKPR